ncbi:MAG: integrase arm-type DNA-binding domain-containing protein [Pseudomonadota bacterium]
MPKVSLTDLAIQKLKLPETGQVDYWDQNLPGFGVRVSKGGTRSFMVLAHRERKHLGRYPTMSLKDARTEARRLLFDPVVAAQIAPPVIMFKEAVEQYLRAKSTELRASTFRDYTRLLGRFQFRCSVADIRPYMVTDALDEFTRRTDKSHAFTVLKVFFGWCLAQEYCRSNPMQHLKKPKLPPARDRVLDDDELTEIWAACEELGKYGSIVRLLMLTGQRAGQIAWLQEKWINKEKTGIEFPAEVMKNNREHYCPIGGLTKFVLMVNVPVKGYYFSPLSAVGRPFSAWSKNKRKLDELVQLDPWRLHDLRRTWSTNAPRLDIPPHITSRILSHAAPEGAIARIYNRYMYRDEMADAMNRMNDHILSLVDG